MAPGTVLVMIDYPCAEDALAAIESDEALAFAILIRDMTAVWISALVEEYVRRN